MGVIVERGYIYRISHKWIKIWFMRLLTQADLRSEIETLKYQMDHNPQLTKYAADIQHLKNELKLVRSQGVESLQVDNRKMEELERMYRDLLEEQKGQL